MLNSIICTMASPRENITDLKSAYIKSAIKTVLSQKGNRGCPGDVSDELLKHEDKIARDCGEILKQYGPGGQYGHFFTGEANINLKAKFVVIELEEISKDPELMPVVVQMLISEITNQIYLGDRKTLYRVILDEAWALLEGGQMKKFIETAARCFRKFESGLVVGTQSVNDLYKNEAAKACFDNSDWMMAFTQKPESITLLKESGKLSMNSHVERQLNSLKLSKGHYSEALLKGPNSLCTVVRVMLDPFSNILYSTDPVVCNKVKEYQATGLSIEAAIEKVAGELL